ncbi:hypothetical protein I317_01693 [Kwoniella heveanensis CBS 569]|nr:hypothetical protein I317_01693 [Kwoniella heveanensis CBS 569]
MPYVPPGSNTVQPIAIPIGKTHQVAEGIPISEKREGPSAGRHGATSLPSDGGHASSSIPLSFSLRSNEDVPTPRASDSTVSDSTASASAREAIMIPAVDPTQAEPLTGRKSQQDHNGITLDSLASALASSSLSTSPEASMAASTSSAASTPPLEESSRSLHQSSPAASSVVSLPEQEEHQHIEDVKHSNSDSSLSANRSDSQVNSDTALVGKRAGEVEEEDTEDESRKVAGDIESKPTGMIDSHYTEATVGTVVMPVSTDAERDPFTLYREGIYAYTVSWSVSEPSSAFLKAAATKSPGADAA